MDSATDDSMAEHFWMETNSALKKVAKRAQRKVQMKALKRARY